MAGYDADTSVLVKRHIHEPGTPWVQALADPAAGNILVTSRISVVEVISALNRRVREATLDRADYQQVVADFDALCAHDYELIELNVHVVTQARLLLEHHPLRAYDAVHLASALLANAAIVGGGGPALIFLSADERLLLAAQGEALATDNPNLHP